MKTHSPRPSLAKLALVAPAVVGALLLGACSTQPGTAAQGSGSGSIPVVASTSVYGDIVKAVGADKVSVTSIISKQSQDPHSYEATTQDRVAVSKARLVVLNGHGYDDFMLKLADEAKLPSGSLVNAVDASGLATSSPSAGPGGKDEFNEHIWYSTDAMKKVAGSIADRLGALDPTDAHAFKDRASQWEAKLAPITGKLAAIKAAHHSQAVAVTEPVPLYMLEAAGLQNRTPAAFSAAVEADNDVPPAALKQMQDLISTHQVALLAHNPQTETPQTQALKKFAQDAHVPVVDFTETMPEGTDYITWMIDNADALSTALGTSK
ncbi:zinc/manganese transport system substrate-binding protein [Sinomonas atrocyanea]|uniref:metal ABC transporter solute-binding protein, Zn/Mn family n=1 Tax=Sinomonas atrocyanea TaxID=37927 RepID=UPI0027824C29|nr:zinc ABC transporter substrate-binding protein [Sinomonas atrocyanea]MDQ0261408.1 zinc/manganese transport system substrate-binding protein [Sinomonas atrocyanea]